MSPRGQTPSIPVAQGVAHPVTEVAPVPASSAFVGRQAELGRLRAALDRAVATNHHRDKHSRVVELTLTDLTCARAHVIR